MKLPFLYQEKIYIREIVLIPDSNFLKTNKILVFCHWMHLHLQRPRPRHLWPEAVRSSPATNWPMTFIENFPPGASPGGIGRQAGSLPSLVDRPLGNWGAVFRAEVRRGRPAGHRAEDGGPWRREAVKPRRAGRKDSKIGYCGNRPWQVRRRHQHPRPA